MSHDPKLSLPQAPAPLPGLALAVRRAPDGTFSLPMDDPITLDLYGFPPDELRQNAQVLFQRIFPADLSRMMAAIEASRTSQGPFHMRWRFEHPRKGWRWLEAWSYPQQEDDGSCLWRGFAMDITAQADLEEALVEQASKLREAFEQSAIGMVLSLPDGQILQANAAFCGLVGWDPLQIVGMNLVDDLTWPADQAESQKTRRELPDLEPSHARLEKRFRHKQGSPVWTQTDISVVRASDGKPVHYLSQIHDISQRKAAEEALRTTLDLLNISQEAAQAGVWTCDLETGQVWWSDAFCRLAGLDPATVRPNVEAWIRLVHPDDRHRASASFARMAASEQGEDLEWRLLMPDGSERWLLSRAISEKDASGRAVRLLGISLDITDQRSARERLKASEETFNRAFSAAPMAMSISRVRDGSILEVNSEFTRLTGHTPEEAIGRTSVELGVLSADERKHMVADLSPEGRLKNRALTLRAKDGTLRHVLVSVECTDLHGEPTFINMLQDLTLQRQAERARHETEARLQLLVDHAPASLAMFDRDMRYLAVSQRWLDDYKLPMEALIGRSHYDVFPEIPETWKAIHQRGLSGETIRADEDCFPRLDGSIQWLRWEVHPWHQPEGDIGGIVIFSEDITARKLAEEARTTLQNKLAAALESLTDAVYISDAEGRFLEFNEAFATFHKFSDKAQCPQTFEAYPEFLELFLEDGTPAPVDQWPVPRAIRGEVATNVIYSLRRRDTGASWVGSYSFAPILNAAGQILGSVVVGRDVTEQRRLQQSLQESEVRYRSLFEMSQAVMLVLDPETGRIEDANPAAERFYGWSHQELLERRLDQINPRPSQELFPVLRQVHQGRLTQLFTQHQLSDGRLRDVEVFANPIQIQGRPRNFAIVHDITERTEAEAAAQRQAKEMDLFFEANLDLLCIASTEGRFLRVNPQWERVLGYPTHELEGIQYLDLVHPDDHQATLQAMARLRNQEAVTDFINRYQCRDGSYRWIEWKTTVHGDRVYAAARDITARREAEAVLRASGERFRQISEAAGEWIWETDADGLYTYASPVVECLLGYRPEELVAKVRIHDLWPEPFRGPLMDQLLGVFQARGAFRNLPNPCLHKEGSVVQIEATGFPILDTTGKLLGYRGTSRDVTEREKAQEALRRSQERFEKAFQSNPIPMAITRESTFALLEVNGSWEHLTGVTRTEAQGKTLEQLGLQIDGTTEGEARASIRTTGSLRNHPIRLRVRDGSVRDLLLSGERIELDGEACVVSSAQDITEQRVAEHARKESDMRFQELFEHAPVALWEEDLSRLAFRFQAWRAQGVTDLHHHLEAHPEDFRALTSNIQILAANAACLKLLGVSTTEELVRELPMYFTDATYAMLKEAFLVLFNGGTRFDAEAPHKDHHGRTIDLQLHLSVMPGHEEDLSRVLVSFIDLTERKAAETERHHMELELNHLQRLDSLGRLAGGVSHDMNNVLGAIMAVGSLLKLRHKEDPQVQKDAEALLQAAVRGRDLVKGLRDFSRKELDSAVDMDLNEVVRREADLLERTTLKKVDIVLDLAPDLPPFFGEASSIQNALMNLCLNSVDAMPQRGKLTLSTRDLGQGFVEVAVQDNGEGMSPEVVARALEPFFTTKPVGKGTGLGLSQVYGTVKAHGGSLDIQSKLGEGTRITMTLPCTLGHGLAKPREGSSPVGPHRPLDILLVDDEELIRGTVMSLLGVLGHRPQAASSGLEAIRRLEAGMQVDLVMLDINMPGMDGVDTLSRLRIMRPDLPVLFATGFADDRIPAILRRFPDVRVLNKPFRMEEVERILAGWL